MGRGGVPYVYASDVITFLKLFSMMSELCGVKCVGSGGWRDRMWQSCSVSIKARCLVFMEKMIYAMSSAMSVHGFFRSAWGDRKDSPIRSFWAGIIQQWSKNLLCECVFTLQFEALAFGKHSKGMSRNFHELVSK